MWTYRYALAAAGLLLAGRLHAQEAPAWYQKMKLSGLAFGDVYVMAANHDTSIEGASGLWVRRVYLTADNHLSDHLSLRVRFEMSSPGDFSTAGKIEPFVKDLWLRWSKNHQQVIGGLSSTPTFGIVEDFWGYRPVEKTPLDLQKFAPSRDLGVAWKGWLDRDGRVRVHAMLATGSGTKAETNQGKKGYLAVELRPVKGAVVQLYGDAEDRPGETDRTTFHGFAAYRSSWGRVGAEFASQHRQVAGSDGDDLSLVSGFIVANVHPMVSLFGRYDRMFDPNPGGGGISYLPQDPRARSNVIIAGVDLKLEGNVHLIPNIEAVVYDAPSGSNPDTDVMLRTTFFVRF